MRILVTGGGGMLGRALVPLLEEAGHEVLAVGRSGGPRVARCDITDHAAVKRTAAGFRPGALVHLAGMTGNVACEEHPKGAIQTNVQGTYNVISACSKYGPAVVLASTREVYAASDGILTESSRMDPMNINGITKMGAELMAERLCSVHGMRLAVARFSNFVGEDNEERGISSMFRAAIQDRRITIYGGSQEIDPLHYLDAADAVTRLLESDISGTFNVASGSPSSISGMVDRLGHILGREVRAVHRKRRPFESEHCRMDVSKAAREAGFRARIDLDEILKRMVSRWAET